MLLRMRIKVETPEQPTFTRDGNNFISIFHATGSRNQLSAMGNFY